MTPTEHIEDRLVKRQIDLLRVAASEVRRTSRALRELERKLVSALQNADPSDLRTQAGRNKRLERYLDRAQPVITETYSRLNRQHSRTMEALAEDESSHLLEISAVLLAASLLKRKLAQRDLAEIAERTLVDGAPAREYWQIQSRSLHAGYRRHLRRGLIAGESLTQLTRRIRGLREFSFRNGLRAFSERQARTLIETSVLATANAAHLATYKANDIAIVQASNPLDGRTSPICRARAGKAWRLDTGQGVNTSERFPGSPPWHFRCRTILIPATSPATLAPGLDFDTWLSRRSASEQQEILGAGRYDLWKDGHLTMSQLVDQTGRPLTIDELRARA